MKNVPDRCPICESELIVTEMYCASCATTISGQFEMLSSPLHLLNSKQLNFVLTFIRCEGKFNRMEEELEISYPTLRNRFNEILDVMGFSSKNTLDQQQMRDERMKILRSLEDGTIEPGEAESLLNEL